MTKKLRPIDIARNLGISTSALRHYEAWGVIPKVHRTTTGYREYTEEHVAYFECLRAMAPGFGVKLTSEILRFVQKEDMNQALWLLNESMAGLHREKEITENGPNVKNAGAANKRYENQRSHKSEAACNWRSSQTNRCSCLGYSSLGATRLTQITAQH
jgi:DNA-binding transcriptional MerR regulator